MNAVLTITNVLITFLFALALILEPDLLCLLAPGLFTSFDTVVIGVGATCVKTFSDRLSSFSDLYEVMATL